MAEEIYAIKVECAPRLNNIHPWEAGARELFETADGIHGLSGGGPVFSSYSDRRPGLEGQLWRFLRDITDDVYGKIAGMQLTLNDYGTSLGLGLISARSELLDANGDPISLPDGEEAPFTIGSVLPPMSLRAQVLARFVVSRGCEELTAATGNLNGRTYARGERMVPVTQEFSLRTHGGIIHNGDPLIVPKGSSVAISVPVLNPDALKTSGLEYMEVLPGRDPHDVDAVLYLCRYRTHEAALRASPGYMK